MATPFTGLFGATSPVYAVFRPDDDTENFVVVEAWDGNGQAYIVGDTALTQASLLPGFNRLYSTYRVEGRPDHAKKPSDTHIVHVPPGQA